MFKSFSYFFLNCVQTHWSSNIFHGCDCFGVECYSRWSLWPLHFNRFTLQLPIETYNSLVLQLQVSVFTRRKDIRSTVNAYKPTGRGNKLIIIRGVLVFLKFGQFSSELTKTWSSGATECRV